MIGRIVAVLVLLLALAGCDSDTSGDTATTTPSTVAPATVTPEEARAIAKEAYIYGFPMVDNYRIQYAYFVNKEDPEYKGGWNEIHNTARVYTPEDKAIQSPNSDTPYSSHRRRPARRAAGAHRAAGRGGRYYSLQFVDGYTYNFAYVGSRTTGNGGGKYLLAGPGWQGEKPEGINEVIRSDTELAFVLYRTQLFGPVGPGQREEDPGGLPGHTAVGVPQPAVAGAGPADRLGPAADAGPAEDLTAVLRDPELRDCVSRPPCPSEQNLRDRFATIGIGPDGTFDADKLTPGDAHGGRRTGWPTPGPSSTPSRRTSSTPGRSTPGDFFGSRQETLDGNYLYRMAGAVLGIYGNTKAEALYPSAMSTPRARR